MSDRDRKKKDRREKRKARKTRLEASATIAHYGPDDHTITKIVVGISRPPGSKPSNLRRWVATDVTTSPAVRAEILEFIKSNNVTQIIFTTGVIGCIHEEGKDYPTGQECPFCRFWHGKDRWAKARPLVLSLGRFRNLDTI